MSMWTLCFHNGIQTFHQRFSKSLNVKISWWLDSNTVMSIWDKAMWTSRHEKKHRKKHYGSLTYIQVTWLLWLCHIIFEVRDINETVLYTRKHHSWTTHFNHTVLASQNRKTWESLLNRIFWGFVGVHPSHPVIPTKFPHCPVPIVPLGLFPGRLLDTWLPPWLPFQQWSAQHCSHDPPNSRPAMGRWRLKWIFAFSSLKGLKLWFWLKKSDGFFKELQKTMETQTKCGIPQIYWTWTSFQEPPTPHGWKNPFPWNGLGQILGCGFASQQGRVERQLQVTHRNLGFGYPGAYDA